MSDHARAKDLLIAAFGFLLAHIAFWGLGKFSIQVWVLKFLVYTGGLTFLLYIIRLRNAAVGMNPDSRQAFKEYLKLGSFYCFILLISELPTMLSTL